MRRRAMRLRDYDYRQNGAYLVTLCTHQGACLFGDILDGDMVLNELGTIVQDEWLQTETVRSYIELDAFAVMPNHLHGIILLSDNGDERASHRSDGDVRAARRAARSTTLQAGSLGAIVAQFKGTITKRSRQLPDCPDMPIWQRNYYDHIIRREAALNHIRAYIDTNAARWFEDSLYVE